MIISVGVFFVGFVVRRLAIALSMNLFFDCRKKEKKPNIWSNISIKRIENQILKSDSLAFCFFLVLRFFLMCLFFYLHTFFFLHRTSQVKTAKEEEKKQQEKNSVKKTRVTLKLNGEL